MVKTRELLLDQRGSQSRAGFFAQEFAPPLSVQGCVCLIPHNIMTCQRVPLALVMSNVVSTILRTRNHPRQKSHCVPRGFLPRKYG